MFIPIGDSPNPRYTPHVTWGLMAINIVVFLLCLPLMGSPVDRDDAEEVRAYIQAIASERQLTQKDVDTLVQHLTDYDLVVFEHGARPGELRLADMFASMFLHGGWMHLIGNMLFLWIYGNNVEHHLGRGKFLVFYLGTGLCAVLGDSLIRMGSNIPSVGASGAISGVLGAYFLWFPQNRVRLFVAFFPFFVDVVEVSARWVLGAYVVLDNLLPMLLAGGSGGGVSHGAHLGGFVAGAAAAFAANRLLERPESPLRGREVQAKPATAERLAAFRVALSEGRAVDAASFFLALPRRTTRELVTAPEKRILALQLERGGNERAALKVYGMLVQDHPGTTEAVDADIGTARLLLEVFGMPAESYAALRRVDGLALTADQRAEQHRLVEILRRVTRSVPRDEWN